MQRGALAGTRNADISAAVDQQFGQRQIVPTDRKIQRRQATTINQRRGHRRVTTYHSVIRRHQASVPRACVDIRLVVQKEPNYIGAVVQHGDLEWRIAEAGAVRVRAGIEQERDKIRAIVDHAPVQRSGEELVLVIRVCSHRQKRAGRIEIAVSNRPIYAPCLGQ